MASLSLSHNCMSLLLKCDSVVVFLRDSASTFDDQINMFLMLAFKMLHNLVLVNSERTLRFGSSCKLDSPGKRSHTHSLCSLGFQVPCASCWLYSRSSLSHLSLTSKAQYLMAFLSLCPFMKYLEVSLPSEPFSFNNLNTLTSTWILFIYSLNMSTCNQYL